MRELGFQSWLYQDRDTCGIPKGRYLVDSRTHRYNAQEDVGFWNKFLFRGTGPTLYKIELSCQKESSHSVVGSGMTSQRLY